MQFSLVIRLNLGHSKIVLNNTVEPGLKLNLFLFAFWVLTAIHYLEGVLFRGCPV
jgi:hypothetical protein